MLNHQTNDPIDPTTEGVPDPNEGPPNPPKLNEALPIKD
jgi:hypothetical protein